MVQVSDHGVLARGSPTEALQRTQLELETTPETPQRERDKKRLVHPQSVALGAVYQAELSSAVAGRLARA